MQSRVLNYRCLRSCQYQTLMFYQSSKLSLQLTAFLNILQQQLLEVHKLICLHSNLRLLPGKARLGCKNSSCQRLIDSPAFVPFSLPLKPGPEEPEQMQKNSGRLIQRLMAPLRDRYSDQYHYIDKVLERLNDLPRTIELAKLMTEDLKTFAFQFYLNRNTNKEVENDSMIFLLHL